MSKAQYKNLLDRLASQIESREFKIKDKLPSINQVAIENQVSVATVREVYKTLESKGYILIQQGRGTFVNYDQDSSNRFIDSSFFMRILKLTEYRAMVEPAFAAESAKQAYNEEINKILESTEIIHKLASNNEPTYEEDLRFHQLIANSTHNEFVIKSYANLQNELKVMHMYPKKEEMIEKAVHYHEMIAQSIANRDSDAARMYMLSHLNDKNSELATYHVMDIQNQSERRT